MQPNICPISASRSRKLCERALPDDPGYAQGEVHVVFQLQEQFVETERDAREHFEEPEVPEHLEPVERVARGEVVGIERAEVESHGTERVLEEDRLEGVDESLPLVDVAEEEVEGEVEEEEYIEHSVGDLEPVAVALEGEPVGEYHQVVDQQKRHDDSPDIFEHGVRQYNVVAVLPKLLGLVLRL